MSNSVGNVRIRRASYNMIGLMVYEIVCFICNLIIPRLIISTYGSAYNGMIASITQFLNFVSILRMGVAGATRVSLYGALANNDKNRVSAIIKATQSYMQKIGYIILVYVLLLSIIYPLLIKEGYSYLDTSFLVFAIGIGTFTEYFYGITYRTLLRADQKMYIYNIIQTIAMLINTIIASILIVSGQTIQIVKLVSVLIIATGTIVINKYAIWKYKIDRKCKPDEGALEMKNDVMGHSIANIIHEKVDVIVLTFFADIKIVSVYSVYNLVMTGIKQVFNVFTSSAESIFGNMWANKEYENIKRNLSYFEYLVSVFIVIVFSATFILIIPFVKLYTKGVYDINYSIPSYAIVIIIAEIFYCLRAPYLSLVQAAGHYKETKRIAYFEALINLSISILLVNFIGILGTAVGTLLANLVRTVQYSLYVSQKLVNRKSYILVKRLCWSIFNIVLSLLICNSIMKIDASINWLNWILNGLISVLISLLCSLLTSVIFYKNDLNGVVNIFVRMVKK